MMMMTVLHLNVNVATCFNLFKFSHPLNFFFCKTKFLELANLFIKFWADMWVHCFLNFEFEAVTSKQTVINY